MENSRRDMMAGACAAAAMTFAPAALAAWEPSQRYPEPTVQSLDPSFNKYRLALAGVERLAPGSALRANAMSQT
jgi:gluconolactonase